MLKLAYRIMDRLSAACGDPAFLLDTVGRLDLAIEDRKAMLSASGADRAFCGNIIDFNKKAAIFRMNREKRGRDI